MEAGTAAGRQVARPEVVLRELKPAQRGWLAWLTTTDHKKIGILYLFATFLFFILGGVEALIMRLQLAQPNNTLVTPDQYTAWYDRQASAIEASGKALAEQRKSGEGAITP